MPLKDNDPRFSSKANMTDKEDSVIARSYSTRQLADEAVLELASCGINAEARFDDAGGAMPSLDIAHGIPIMVATSNAVAARRVLADFDSRNNMTAEAVQSGMSLKSSSVIFGILLGTVVTSCCWWFHIHRYDNLTYEEYGKSGKVIAINHYKQGKPFLIERDRNGDGKMDEWWNYREGEVSQVESDDNFDGKIDRWGTYSNDFDSVDKQDSNFDGKPDMEFVYVCGVMSQIRSDLDFNGVFDSITQYKNGQPSIEEIKPNDTTVVSLRRIFIAGNLKEEWIDENMDGAFDLKKEYDPMGKEISLTPLHK